MDLSSLNAILRVNGLTAQSTPEQITSVLEGSGYTGHDVSAALAMLKGEASAGVTVTPSSTEVTSILINTVVQRTSTITSNQPDVSLVVGRIGVFQFSIATAVSLLVFCIVFVVLEVTAMPLFTLASGVSLLSLPDLSLAPLQTVFLVGLAVALISVPWIFFFVLVFGLHLRRFHDAGLSGMAWFGVTVAAIVLSVLIIRIVGSVPIGALVVFLLYTAFLCWPGSAEENMYGPPITYPTVWGSIIGSLSPTGNAEKLAKRFIVPVIGIEVAIIILGLCIHIVLPHAHASKFSFPTISTPLLIDIESPTVTSK